ncbi:MAG: hypothetical protein GEU88_12840 [Solirubrobacterales bacterium]|nr:hypothetical protein [Solirubrobacterales bacterium]
MATTLAGALATLAAVVPALPSEADAARQTVTLSGRAYAFNHMDTPLAGATIRVRELPRLAATTDARGDYALEVPDEANLTPYIAPPPGYNEIDLQTFHPRGSSIENANFQVPADAEYNGLAALLSVPIGADGRPRRCVIVTTASARNVRGVDYETFEARTPHGVAGATAHAEPGLGSPIYFNDSVIPDPSRSETSGDGGIIWTGVPAGVYRVATEGASTRFASFLATCEPGRIVNANPPWGAYELARGERPLGAGVVAGSVVKVANGKRAGHRLVTVKLRIAEPLRAKLVLRQDGRRIAPRRGQRFGVGIKKTRLRVAARAERGRAKLRVTLTDSAGDSISHVSTLHLPRASRD